MSSFEEIFQKRLLSERSGETLNVCQSCSRLIHPHEAFVVSKAYSKGCCVLETSHCLNCNIRSRTHISEQSLENLSLYSGRPLKQFMEDPFRRRFYHLSDPTCLLTGENLESKGEFEIHTFQLPGSELGDENFILVGPAAMEQMSELLSEETRRSWERYLETIQPGSPNIRISPVFM